MLAYSLSLCSGFLVPFLVGVLTEGTDGLGPCHAVFYMTIGILSFEALIFTIFGEGRSTVMEFRKMNKN